VDPAAVALTPAQLTALKAAIAADPALAAQPGNSDGADAIADALNLPAVPDFWVWRSVVPEREILEGTSPDATTFNWVGNGFVGRTVQELLAWQVIFGQSRAINASLANVRAAFGDILSGTGNAAANRAHLLAVARRKATRAEKLLATGTGSTAAPAVLGFEGKLGYPDVDAARAA
jgi:hypothetical protein